MKASRFYGKKRFIMLFLVGMAIFLYPTISNLFYYSLSVAFGVHKFKGEFLS